MFHVDCHSKTHIFKDSEKEKLKTEKFFCGKLNFKIPYTFKFSEINYIINFFA